MRAPRLLCVPLPDFQGLLSSASSLISNFDLPLMPVSDADPYEAYGAQWYVNQDNL